MRHKILIPCVAPKTTAQSSLRFSKSGGVFKDKKGQQCRETWVSLLAPHAPERPFENPTTLRAIFTWPWRKAEPKKNKVLGWMPMNTKPDLDNLSKIFVDTLVTTGFLLSDQIIWRITLVKGWGDNPSVSLTLDDDWDEIAKRIERTRSEHKINDCGLGQ